VQDVFKIFDKDGN